MTAPARTPFPERARSRGGNDEVRQRILALVDSIPCGRVATYGGIARAAGLPRRARLVGRILGSLPPGNGLPWHRVVNAAGRISDRPGASPSEQRRRLAREGVTLDSAGRVDLRRLRWDAEREDEPGPGEPGT